MGTPPAADSSAASAGAEGAAAGAGILNMDDDFLRRVEIDVVIPKMVKKSAKEACKDAVKAFEDCGHNKFISLLWECRDVRDAMYECFKAHSTEADFEREKANFIRLRKENRERLRQKELEKEQLLAERKRQMQEQQQQQQRS